MRWNPDLLGCVTPFVEINDIGRFAVASRDVDAALRQPDERASVLAHLPTEVRAAASLEHCSLAVATKAWGPVGANRRRRAAHLVIDNDARNVAARCAEVATLLRRHPKATCRVEAHAGVDLQPVLAFALATARARLVRDRLIAAFARLGIAPKRLELASMRPRAPDTRVEVYLRLRDGRNVVEVPARPTDGAPPHAQKLHVRCVWRYKTMKPWPLSRMYAVTKKWLGKSSSVLKV
jgi:hypothetical protein